MVISKLIQKSNEILKKAGIQTCVLDTQLLLSTYLGVDKLYLITYSDAEVENEQGFFELVQRRAKLEPMQYILGRCEFMSIEFEVEPGVLIPRPDTEILVETIIDYIGEKPLSMLEIGTGSGCIALSCARYCKNLTVDAVDVSKKALEIAKKNSRNCNIDRVKFINMDILSDFPKSLYDVVVSNPPYIESRVLPELMRDVRDYEPITALDGGADGLMFYRRIAEKSKGAGFIAFEVGHDQSKRVIEILKENNFRNIEVVRDLSSIERVITAKGGV